MRSASGWKGCGEDRAADAKWACRPLGGTPCWEPWGERTELVGLVASESWLGEDAEPAHPAGWYPARVDIPPPSPAERQHTAIAAEVATGVARGTEGTGCNTASVAETEIAPIGGGSRVALRAGAWACSVTALTCGIAAMVILLNGPSFVLKAMIGTLWISLGTVPLVLSVYLWKRALRDRTGTRIRRVVARTIRSMAQVTIFPSIAGAAMCAMEGIEFGEQHAKNVELVILSLLFFIAPLLWAWGLCQLCVTLTSGDIGRVTGRVALWAAPGVAGLWVVGAVS